MIVEFLAMLQAIWYWLLTQLGWEGIELGWLPILVLVLAVVGALVVLRNLLGGRSGSGGGGGGNYPSYAPPLNQRGLTTKFYTGREGLSDFSVNPKVYDFKVPTPTPNLPKLREPLNLDLEKASSMYLVPNIGASRSETMARNFQSIYGKEDSRPEPGPASLTTGEEQQCASNSGVTFQAATPSKLDWNLAAKLFVPNIRRKP